MRRGHTASPQSERCAVNVILKDGNGAQCMRPALASRERLPINDAGSFGPVAPNARTKETK